jgi:hypothetical protein
MSKMVFVYSLLLLVACGQKSKVTPFAPAVSWNESHGNGEFATFTVKIPLSESSIDPMTTPIDPQTGVARVPFLGDVMRLVGQSTFNFILQGRKLKKDFTIRQPIPEVTDEVLKHVSIKRVFFHIDQDQALENSRPRNWLDRLRHAIRGSDDLDFSFIERLNINMVMSRTDAEPESYLPCVDYAGETEPVPCTGGARTDKKGVMLPSQVFLRYHQDRTYSQLNNSALGATFVVYADKVSELRRFFESSSEFNRIIKDITIVNKTLVVELKGRLVEREAFFELLERHEAEISHLDIPKFDECSHGEPLENPRRGPRIPILNDGPTNKALTCMDFKLSNANLLPILMRGNQLQVETQVELGSVPPRNFQLKGFVEFEIKIKSPI